jgi:hypothetical protein
VKFASIGQLVKILAFVPTHALLDIGIENIDAQIVLFSIQTFVRGLDRMVQTKHVGLRRKVKN